MNLKYKTIFYHLFFWIIYLTYLQLVFFWTKPDYSFHYLEILIMSITYASIFYFQAFVTMPVLIKSKKYFYGVLLFIFYLLFYLLVNYEVYYVYFLDFTTKKILVDFSFFYFLFKKNIFGYIDFSMYGIAYWQFLNYKFKRKAQLKENELNYDIKIDYLKIQLNQNFLKEMLEYYKKKTQNYSISLANSFDQLSNIVGYTIIKKNNYSNLKDEIHNVNNFIALNQERYNNKLKVQISIKGEINDFYIPHLMLLTLVENAFKHGNLKTHLFIFDLNVHKNTLYVKIINKINYANIIDSTKIGIKNINERLEILFGSNYEFNSSVIDDKYVTNIILTNLNRDRNK